VTEVGITVGERGSLVEIGCELHDVKTIETRIAMCRNLINNFIAGWLWP
jgi:hypothetical protein